MKSAPNMPIFFFSRIPAYLLEGQIIFVQHISGKKVTPQRRFVLYSSKPDECIFSRCPKKHNQKTHPVLTAFGTKLFRFRVEEEPATESESIHEEMCSYSKPLIFNFLLSTNYGNMLKIKTCNLN